MEGSGRGATDLRGTCVARVSAIKQSEVCDFEMTPYLVISCCVFVWNGLTQLNSKSADLYRYSNFIAHAECIDMFSPLKGWRGGSRLAASH